MCFCHSILIFANDNYSLLNLVLNQIQNLNKKMNMIEIFLHGLRLLLYKYKSQQRRGEKPKRRLKLQTSRENSKNEKELPEIIFLPPGRLLQVVVPITINLRHVYL